MQHSTLQQQLDRIKLGFRARAPIEVVRSIDSVIDRLVAAGVEQQPLEVGDRIPAFSLRDTEGRVVTSAELLQSGPAVLSFYRGGW